MPFPLMQSEADRSFINVMALSLILGGWTGREREVPKIDSSFEAALK
jgi:hypothetical protein